jgi:hypothetical protein
MLQEPSRISVPSYRCSRSHYGIHGRDLKQLLARTFSRFNYRSERFVTSCLSPSLSSRPMISPTHRPIGRSQATTDAPDRVKLIHQYFGFRHTVTQDARTTPAQIEVHPVVAVLYQKP